MRWANFFHIYQPPGWPNDIIRRVVRESYQPLLAILRRHPSVHITLHISGALTEQLLALGEQSLLEDLRFLVEREQIELVGGAMYHPILPLLPAQEVRRQIILQTKLHERVFGPHYRPTGFFAPEMAYGPDLDPILRGLGYEWILLDEPAAGETVINFEHQYVSTGGLGVVFRHRALSDFLSFAAAVEHPQEVAAVLRDDLRAKNVLVTAMDGENLGHHRHGVDHLWERLVTQPDLAAITVSEYRRGLTETTTMNLRASSWSSLPDEIQGHVPYGLWNHPNNPIHKLQWQLTYLVIGLVNQATTDPGYQLARHILDQALASDKFWWASASPWWDPGIVRRETARLVAATQVLSRINPATRQRVAQVFAQCDMAISVWGATGQARHRQQTYLAAGNRIHYMAGQRVR